MEGQMKKNVHSYSDFGKQVKIAMIQMGLTNKEMARRLGYKESTLCDILKGRNRNERRIREIKEVLSDIRNQCG